MHSLGPRSTYTLAAESVCVPAFFIFCCLICGFDLQLIGDFSFPLSFPCTLSSFCLFSSLSLLVSVTWACIYLTITF